MILFPAIDLKDGQCVRLKLGDMEPPPSSTTIRRRRRAASRTRASSTCTSSTSTAPSPASRSTAPAVEAILRPSTIPVQLGGGIRDLAHHRELARQRHRAASSSARPRCAIPTWCARPAREFPGRIAVGIDAKGGKVAVEGWAETSELDRRSSSPSSFEDAGVAAIIYTDIERDGVLEGLNLEATVELARRRRSPSSPPAASPRSTTSRRCSSPSTRSSRAPSPAARSTTAASIRRRRSPCFPRI